MALWDPRWVKAKAFTCFAGIFLEGYICGLNGCIHVLNLYGPYKNRFLFWDKLISYGLMEMASLIIVGDFNCTVGLDEVWGGSKNIDPLVGLIHDAIIDHNLVDVCPQTMVLTWDNGRVGMTYVVKRMDRLILHEQLVERLEDVHVGFINNYLFDHRPITLQWRRDDFIHGLPFKFNQT